MKKIIALALTALLLISLVACNSDDTSDLTNIGDYAAPSYTHVTDKGVFTFKEGAGDTAIITGYTATTTAPHAVTVPATIGEADDRIVTAIGTEAFKEASAYITSIILPESITTIEAGAFHSCSSLADINIPDSVTSIGNLAFYGCTSLATVKLGENSELVSIGNYAFADCKALEAFSFTNKLESIGTAAFKGSAIKEVKLPESVTTIGAQAFVECENLNYEGCITLTAGITSIGKHAFSTDVANIVIPEGSYAEKYFGLASEEETTTGENAEETTEESSEEASEEATDATTEEPTDAPTEETTTAAEA